jgi:hypothetical protein
MNRRFFIRYAVQRWDDIKWFYGALLLVILIVMATSGGGQRMASYVPVLVLVVALLVVFYFGRRFSYVELGADALRIRSGLRRVSLPYAAISRVRKQALEVAFQPAERRRYANRFVRRLARQPAVYIRIDRRESDLRDTAERTLGPRIVAGPDVVLPITGVDEFVSEMKNRLKSST